MFLKYNYGGLLWALLILSLCAIPGSQLPRLSFLDWLRSDKIVHLFLFGVLSFLFLKGFQRQSTFISLHHSPKLYSFFICAAYGIAIELLQEYVFSHRTGEVYDAIADAAGALIGIWIYKAWPGSERRLNVK